MSPQPQILTVGTPKKIRVLTILVLTLAGLNAILVFAALSAHQQAGAVHLVPGLDAERIVKPNSPSDEMLRLFAAHFLFTQETYTPATIDRVHEALLARISPDRYGEAKRFFERRAEAVRKGQISSSLVLDDLARVPVTKLDEWSWKVRLQGQRRTYMGAEFVAENALAFEVVMEIGTPTELNPHALYVVGATSSPSKGEGTK